MDQTVTELRVALPDKRDRARAAATGRKPMAAVEVVLESGRVREIVVPVRVGRLLMQDAVALPQPEEDAFDAIHALEGRVCFAMATDMLSRRDHAEAELGKKLRLYGFRDQEIASALERARSLRFVNDDRFASYFIEERVRRGWGPRKIEVELRRRGIDPASVEGFPDAFFREESELDRAVRLLERKAVPEERAREKFIRHLVGKGFSYGVAREAADTVLARS